MCIRDSTITSEIIKIVCNFISIPVIVGGGISSPETASRMVKAGASIIVIGTAIEKECDLMFDFAKAIHWKDK